MKIYVGNLSFDTSEAALRDAFGEYGEIEEAVIITDRETGRSRGFGFITMPDDAQAKAAIEAMNGQALDGRTLNVNEARPKTAGGRKGERW
ncbi:MAG: RNA-binding protein [Phycisphaerales bacterium]|nr:MAG: RNA-binding protein [Phycisphaerales bacterium]